MSENLTHLARKKASMIYFLNDLQQKVIQTMTP